METKQIEEIEKLVKGYERKSKVRKILMGALAIVAAGSMTIMLAK